VAPTRTDCPECGAGVKLPAGVAPGRTVRCPKCETRFVVPGDEEDDPPAKKPVRAAAADDEEEAPRKAKKKKKKAADDDGWSYRSSWVRFAVLGVLLVVLGVLGYMLYKKNERDKEAERNDPPPADRGPTAKVTPDGNIVVDTGKGKTGPPAAAVEEARAALVGEWEYRAGDEAYTVRYTADGLFRYTAERPGDPPATLTGRWALTNPRRTVDRKGAPAAGPTTQVSVEWGVPSRPGLKGDLVLLGDGTVMHPLLDRFEPGTPGKLPVFRKK
jgi:uncharacterized Zn finger protein (UPF0148 family)